MYLSTLLAHGRVYVYIGVCLTGCTGVCSIVYRGECMCVARRACVCIGVCVEPHHQVEGADSAVSRAGVEQPVVDLKGIHSLMVTLKHPLRG